MDLVLCCALFTAGLRGGEVFAVKPDDFDWKTPKLTVQRAWQLPNSKEKRLGPPKSCKSRVTLFIPIFQNALKKLWEENGKHEFAFSKKMGRVRKKAITPGAEWIRRRFPVWLERAGIEKGGRNITPHSARHTLASILEENGVAERYIQEILGHSHTQDILTSSENRTKKTTRIYLHTRRKMINQISDLLTEILNREDKAEEKKVVNFKRS